MLILCSFWLSADNDAVRAQSDALPSPESPLDVVPNGPVPRPAKPAIGSCNPSRCTSPRGRGSWLVEGHTPDAQVLGERNCTQAVECARDVVCYIGSKLCHRACHTRRS